MSEPLPEPLPRSGERVTLRRLRAADLADFQAYRSDAEVGRYQGWEPSTDADASAFLAVMSDAVLLEPGEWCQIGIAERESDRLIGDIGICVSATSEQVEIGFSLCRESQGKGLASEAVAEAIALIFEHSGATCVHATSDERNAASIRLLERLGMTQSTRVEAEFRGESCVEITYSLDRRSRVVRAQKLR